MDARAPVDRPLRRPHPLPGRVAGALAVASLLAVGSLLLNTAGGSPEPYRHLLYVPVVLAAFLFKVPGALMAATAAGLIAGPLGPGPWDGLAWLVRGGFYFLVGGSVGVLQSLSASRLRSVEGLLEKISHAQGRVLSSFASIAELRDRPAGGHPLRMAHNARMVGRAMGLEQWAEEHLYWAALLHDLGKVAVPDEILLKPGPLEREEVAEVRRHVEVGAELLMRASPDFGPVVEGVRAHHERWDGSGYPAGLAGEDIPLPGRILAVVDVFDALTCVRPYRSPVSADEALDYLRVHAGVQFDPEIVRVFGDLYERGEVLLEGDDLDRHPAAATGHRRR